MWQIHMTGLPLPLPLMRTTTFTWCGYFVSGAMWISASVKPFAFRYFTTTSAVPLVPMSCTERTSTRSRKMSWASFWLSAGGTGPDGGMLAGPAAPSSDASANTDAAGTTVRRVFFTIFPHWFVLCAGGYAPARGSRNCRQCGIHGLHRMAPDAAFPFRRIDIKGVADFALHRGPIGIVGPGVLMKPVVAADGGEDIARRFGADFQRREGELLAFHPFGDGLIDRALQRRRQRFARLAGLHIAPHGGGALIGIAARQIFGDHFRRAALAKAGVKIDGDEAAHAFQLFAEHVFEHQMRPAFALPSEIDALRMLVLPGTDRLLQLERAVAVGIGAQHRVRRLHRLARQASELDRFAQFVISIVLRRMLEIGEVAVDVGVVFIDVPVPGKAVRIQRVQQNNPGSFRRAPRQTFAHQTGLHAGPEITFHAMRAGDQQQRRFRIARADGGCVEKERFSVRAFFGRMQAAGDAQTGSLRRRDERVARFAVIMRKMMFD